ncbi:WXG100 family type VII secretion target [Candidatus Oscillochloris fontis]|uniref:WXG100 family type VII secretion target n=1 Tax=Candidatus Oscillochloris fontis TaxID=2496868 RepID=UPI00101C89D1|nr:WXG100 family type VII secretion target [Candidatus Oscillochloris fontis]
MASDEIKVEYDQLDQIRSRFSNQVQAIEEMLREIRTAFEPLSNGGWLGRGANAFFDEMNSEVLPACQKLYNAMNEASQVTNEVSNIMKRGEQEAQSMIASLNV